MLGPPWPQIPLRQNLVLLKLISINKNLVNNQESFGSIILLMNF